MKYLLLVLSTLSILNLSQAQERSFNLSLQTELGALAGVKAEVYQEKELVATLLSDSEGKLSIHLNVFPGTEITVVLKQALYKRYLIDLQELDRDYNYSLKMTALTMNEKKRIEAAEKGEAKLSSNFASIFLKYDKELDSIISVSPSSFEAGKKIKISPLVIVTPAAAAAASKASSSEVFKAREAEYKAEKAAKEAEKAAKEAEEAKKDAVSEQKKLEQKLEDQKDKSEKETKKKEKELAKQQKEQREREKELKKAEKQQKKEQKALNKAAKAQAKAAKKAEKWEKKMASYNKKLAKYNKDKVKIDKSQRKLDKKIRKEKVDAEKAASIQEGIDEERKSLEKHIQDLQQRIKKHRKSSPYGN